LVRVGFVAAASRKTHGRDPALATPDSRFAAYRRARRIVTLTLFALVISGLALVISGVSSASAQTIVSLTFDDGIETQYEVAGPLLAAHGMHGTFYINSDIEPSIVTVTVAG
jgi:peptidoglycan/xylan/chitin deacetylase (PgdA/CDA1 family)